MFEALRKRRWKLNPSKIRLGYQVVKLLGHVIGKGQLRPDPAKLEAIRKLAPPTNTRELKAFLGLTGFYHRIVPGFAKPASVLTKLLRKEADFLWTQAHQTAWQTLKDSLTSQSVVKLPTPDGAYKIYTDWSATAISAILHQQ